MSIILTCVCGKQLISRDEHAGMQVKCPGCGKLVLVPRTVSPAIATQATSSDELPDWLSDMAKNETTASPAKVPRPASPSASAVAAQGAGPTYWLMMGSTPSGPFDVPQIRAKLASGEISWQTLACAPGGNTWLPLGQISDVGPAHAIQAPASRAVAVSVDPLPASAPLPTALASTPRPWNPVAIAWLGLAFSPVWAGIMAAVNGRRLGLGVPFWRPIGIGVGAVVLSLVQGSLIDSYLLDLLLYLGAVGLIGYLDLLPQLDTYRQHIGQGRLAGGWLVPSLAGSPLFLLVFLAFVVTPFLPLQPSQVCEKFLQASSEKELKKYTTNNLWPAVSAMAKIPDKNDSGTVEFTEEGPAPADVGGYLVACRMVSLENGQHVWVEVVFHLVDRQGNWKIEELYYTAVNKQPLEQWIPLSTNYSQMFSVPPDKVTASNSSPAPKADKSKDKSANKSWMDDPKTQRTALYLLRAILMKLFTRGKGK